ncbi:MAG: DUF4129 domain-containing protein [bacterium]|nr:DUF4129 domain-containing protein [bacterium]
MKFRPQESDTNSRPVQPEGPTDFESLMAKPDNDALQASVIAQKELEQKTETPTDYESLTKGWKPGVKRLQRRSPTDWLIAFLAPFLIFLMVLAIIMFLLDVRYVYTEVHDRNLRFVALCFVTGIVALNRVIARDGKDESVLYIIGLGGAIALYTVATTGAYDVGSVARGFLNNPKVALAFNMSIVIFIWWVTNRLMHECCVDENPQAGDMGILTGTARRLRDVMHRAPKAKKQPEMTMKAYDPTEAHKPKKKVKKPPLAAVQRLPKRHPGISIFYFSAPVMIIFALGVRVVPHGGRWIMLMAYIYVVSYTLSALTLLMLTSLGQLREYFRARRVTIPSGLGPFWLTLGLIMVAMVIFGAAALPNPSLPPLAHIESHEIDFWTRTSTFQPIEVVVTEEQVEVQSQVIKWIGRGVLACLGVFALYGAAKAVGAAALAAAKRRDLFPPFVTRVLQWLDRLLQRITRLPALPKFKRRRRMDRAMSESVKYSNPLSTAPDMPMADQVEHAYNALCALAHDYGVPRRPDQTPYEFMEAFPEELVTLRDEAEELTGLYVATAYAARTPGARVEDRLRKFWHIYDRARNRILR